MIGVIGLMVGTRGTIPHYFMETWKRLGLPVKYILKVIINVIRVFKHTKTLFIPT